MKKTRKSSLSEKEIGIQAGNLVRTLITDSAKADGKFVAYVRDLENQTDEGIDFQVELLNRDTRASVITFSLQSKGEAAEVKPNKRGVGKGKISFSLDIKHIHYYRKYRPDGVVITLADLAAGTLYWHPIQLDDDVEPSVEAALIANPRQESVTIYFDPANKLTPQNFGKFVEDMHHSTTAQSYRYNEQPPSDLVPPPRLSTGRVLDDIYDHFREQYQQLRYVPQSLMANRYPFRIGEGPLPPAAGVFRVLTDNPDLIVMLEAIRLVDHTMVEIENADVFAGVEEPLKKITAILRWLTANHIYFIMPLPNFKKVTRSVYLLDPSTQAIMLVLWQRLDFSRLLARLHADTAGETSMEKAYVHFQLRNTVTAQGILRDMAKQAPRGSLQQYLAFFNRKECRMHLYQYYYKVDDLAATVDEIKKVSLEIPYRQCSAPAQRAACGWIHHRNFVHAYQFKIAETVTEIRNRYDNHLKGGWSEHQFLFRLQAEYGAFEGFISENLLFYSHTEDFRKVTALFIEGLMAGYAIRPGFGDRLDGFDDWLLGKILLHGDAEKLLKLVRTYKIKNAKYKKNAIDNYSVTDLIDNLLHDMDKLPAQVGGYADHNHGAFWDVYNKRFSAMLVTTGFLELDDAYTKSLLDKLLKAMTFGFIWPMQSRYLAYFFREKAQYFTEDVFKKLLFAAIREQKWNGVEIFDALNSIAKRLELAVAFDTVEYTELSQFFFTPESSPFKRIERIEVACFFVDHFADANLRQQWLDWIVASLRTEFNEDAYFYLAASDFIPFDVQLFAAFKQAGRTRSRQADESNARFLQSSGKISALPDDEAMGEQRLYMDQLIHLIFKYNYPLTADEKSAIEGINSYYYWLMNMDTFDYTNFHAGWLTRFNSEVFYNEFRKHAGLKVALERYLVENNDQVALKAYFNLYKANA